MMRLLSQFRDNLGLNGIQSNNKPTGPKLWMFRNFLWNSGLARKSKSLRKVHDWMTERILRGAEKICPKCNTKMSWVDTHWAVKDAKPLRFRHWNCTNPECDTKIIISHSAAGGILSRQGK